MRGAGRIPVHPRRFRQDAQRPGLEFRIADLPRFRRRKASEAVDALGVDQPVRRASSGQEGEDPNAAAGLLQQGVELFGPGRECPAPGRRDGPVQPGPLHRLPVARALEELDGFGIQVDRLFLGPCPRVGTLAFPSFLSKSVSSVMCALVC